jgi:HK97 family phage portal protein
VRSLVGSVIDGVRSLRNAAPPVPYVPVSDRTANGMPFGSSFAAGKARELATTGANGTLFAIINKLSTATAAVEWHMHRKAKASSSRSTSMCELCEEEGVTLVTDHPALVVWNRPNDFYTRQEFVETEQQHIDLTGEGWWVVTRTGGRPTELWPVRPDKMAPVRDPKTFTAGYVYRAPDGDLIQLGLDEVVMIRMPSPLDPWRGLSPVGAIMANLISTEAASEYQAQFFQNSALPGGVITVPESWPDVTYQNFKARWAEEHQGTRNAHKVAILEEGATWESARYTQREMQFVEMTGVNREIIREAFAVHGHVLGLSEDVNRANAEAGEYSFAKGLTVPRADRIKAALNNDFLPMFGPSMSKQYEFAYCSPVPEDREGNNAERLSKAQAFTAYVNAGVDPAQAAEVCGLPPLKVTKPEPALPPGAPPRPGQQDPKPPADRFRNAAQIAQSFDLRQVQRDWEAQLDKLLAAWKGITTQQRAELRQQVLHNVSARDLAALAQMRVGTADAERVLNEALYDMAYAAANRVVQEAADQGVTAHPVIPTGVTLAGVATAVAGLLGAGLANSAGREALRLFSAGAVAAEVADQVDTHLAGLSDAYLRENLGGALTRAQNMARIDTMHAAPQAAYYASEQLDKNTCAPCARIDGQKFPGLIEALTAYGGGPYWGCLGGNRCRGTMVAVWEVPE